VSVLLVNLGDEDFSVTRGMRIAQIIFAPVVQVAAEERTLAGDTSRGSGGFGSTGTA
jgi:dUTP pyrophosphatase